MPHPDRSALRWTLWLYLLLGLAYLVSVPPWEGSDEPSHYRRVLQLARGESRPSLADNYEASQPPLYYWLAAGPLRLLERIDPALVEPHLPPLMPALRAAPRHGAGAGAIERLRRHDAFDGRPVFEWSRATYRVLVGVHALRCLGLAFGALAIVLIHRAGLRLAPAQPEIAAGMAGLVALTPQFLHVQTVLANDALANLAGAALFWLLIDIGAADAPEPRWRLAGAVLAALALPFAVKLTLLPLSLAILICAAFALRSRRVGRVSRPHALAFAAASALLGLVIAFSPGAVRVGWDALTSRAAYVRPGALAEIPAIWSSLARSYWGTVGWMSIELPAGAWRPLTFVAGAGAMVSLRLAFPAGGAVRWRDPGTLLALGVALAVAALANDWLANAWLGTSLLLLHLSRRRQPLQAAPSPEVWRRVALCIALALGAALKNALATLQAQGRYLLPAAGALAAAAVGGWLLLLPGAWRARLPALILAGMTALNAWMLSEAIWPAYYQPFLDGRSAPPPLDAAGAVADAGAPAAKRWATAWPMPRPPPVTMALLPSSRPVATNERGREAR